MTVVDGATPRPRPAAAPRPRPAPGAGPACPGRAPARPGPGATRWPARLEGVQVLGRHVLVVEGERPWRRRRGACRAARSRWSPIRTSAATRAADSAGVGGQHAQRLARARSRPGASSGTAARRRPWRPRAGRCADRGGQPWRREAIRCARAEPRPPVMPPGTVGSVVRVGPGTDARRCRDRLRRRGACCSRS